MVHEDFFEKILIEFIELRNGKERIVAKYKNFSKIPVALQLMSKKRSFPLITLKGSKWEILGISKDLRAHGPGIHMKVKMEKIRDITVP